MGHRCEYYDRLEIEDNQLVRVVTAYYKEKSLDIYKEYEDGEFKGRNLTFSNLAGYLVNFPGEEVRIPYSSKIEIQCLEDWWSCYECNLFFHPYQIWNERMCSTLSKPYMGAYYIYRTDKLKSKYLFSKILLCIRIQDNCFM